MEGMFFTSVKYTKSRPLALDPARTMSASRVNCKASERIDWLSITFACEASSVQPIAINYNHTNEINCSSAHIAQCKTDT